ncbi:Cytochrome P450 CYP749A22 [Linum perenne]
MIRSESNLKDLAMLLLQQALYLALPLALITVFLHTLIVKPLLLQRRLNSLGFRGPAYRFFYGNTLEIRKLREAAMAKPMSSLSHDVYHRLQPHLSAWSNTYGSNFVFWIGLRPFLSLSDPDMVREVANDREKAFRKIPPRDIMKQILGDGLVTSEGEKWAKMRKLANFAFFGESLKNMTPAMIASTEMMLERWKSHVGKEIEVYEEFRFLTAEVISRTAFGSSYLEGKQLFYKLSKLVELAAASAFKIRIPGISKIYKSRDDIEADKLEQGIRASLLGMIRKRQEMVAVGEANNFGNDFLGLLVRSHNESDESKRVSVDDVVDECKTFYLAGQETTNTLLSWQLNMIINEALRLYPPASGITREGEDAHLFNPERFSEGVSKATNNNPSAFLPFGIGVRVCVGSNFSANEAKIALSMILQRYEFTLSPTYIHSPTSVITTRPQHGIQVILHALQ